MMRRACDIQVAIVCVAVLCGCYTASAGLATDPCAEGANGCSVPPVYTPGSIDEQFTPYCNKHDICYTCASKYNITRGVCDTKFRDALVNHCWSLEDGNIMVECLGLTVMYYKAVEMFGESHFNTDSNLQDNCDGLKANCLPLK